MKLKIIYTGSKKEYLQSFYTIFHAFLEKIYKKFYIKIHDNEIILSIRPVPISRIVNEISKKCGDNWMEVWKLEKIKED